jgi:hypothetical protein
MVQDKSKIDLIVRGDKWGVQLDVKEFPIICPSCNQYFPELYSHNFSRYGQVGSVNCSCGETVQLTDSDNIVEYIKCHSKDKTVTINFKELYQLTSSDFDIIRTKFTYDIFELHLNDRLNLSDLINEIQLENKIEVTPIESDIPLPLVIKRWIGLKEYESTTIVRK